MSSSWLNRFVKWTFCTIFLWYATFHLYLSLAQSFEKKNFFPGNVMFHFVSDVVRYITFSSKAQQKIQVKLNQSIDFYVLKVFFSIQAEQRSYNENFF